MIEIRQHEDGWLVVDMEDETVLGVYPAEEQAQASADRWQQRASNAWWNDDE